MCDTCVPCEDLPVGADGKKSLTAAASAVMLEDANKKRRFYKLSLLIFDLPIIVLGIVLLVVGIILGIGLFFALSANEQSQVQSLVQYEGTLYAERIKNALNSNKEYTTNTAMLIGLSGVYVTFQQFQLYAAFSAKKTGGNGASLLAWIPHVTRSNYDAIVGFTRQQIAPGSLANPQQENFTIYQLDITTGRRYEDNSLAEYWPVSFQLPWDAVTSQVPGLDLNSIPVHYAAVNRTWVTNETSATERVVLVQESQQFGPYISTFYDLVKDSAGNKIGEMASYFHVKDIVQSAMPVADITVFDVTEGAGNAFLYSSRSEWYNSTFDQNGHSTALEQKLFQSLVQMESSGLIPKRTILAVADRQWALFCSSNDAFLQLAESQHNINVAAKWIALILSIFFGFVLLVVSIAIVVVKRLLYASVVSSLAANKIQELQESRQKMDQLIEKLSAEEQRIRNVINMVPMSILLADEQGVITYANEQFLAGMHYEAQAIKQRKVSLGQVLSSVDIEALTGEGKLINGTSLLQVDRVIIRTSTSTGLGVQRTTRACVSWNRTAGLFTSGRRGARRAGLVHNTARQHNGSFSMDNCFVVIMFDGQYDSLSNTASEGKTPRGQQAHQLQKQLRGQHNNQSKEDLIEMMSMVSDVQEMNAFSQMLYERDNENAASQRLYAEFKHFCESEHSVEGILFYEAVERYRSTEKVVQRVELQQRIVAEFLSTTGSHQLNLPSEKLSQHLPRIMEYLGQVEVFDGLLQLVILDLRLDLFNRFYSTTTTMKHSSEHTRKEQQEPGDGLPQ